MGINAVVCSRKAAATSLLELPGRAGDGETPTAADVEQESRYAGLAG